MSRFDAQFAGRLDGQTVLVTGANGAIGHETAQGIGNSGATVLVHARGAEQARRAVDSLAANGNGKGRYLAVAGDLGSLAGVRELAQAVREATDVVTKIELLIVADALRSGLPEGLMEAETQATDGMEPSGRRIVMSG